MTRIIGLCGSLRRGSVNRLLLRAAAELAPAGTAILEESIREIPLYDGDHEERCGIPAAVERLKDMIADADGLLLVTPEYNHSMPGVFKNAIDWLSRPTMDIPRVFRGRPVAILGATAGPGGTALAQVAWLPVVNRLGMRLWSEHRLLMPDALTAFDADGRVADAEMRQRVQQFIEGFAEFATLQQPKADRLATVVLSPQVAGRDGQNL